MGGAEFGLEQAGWQAATLLWDWINKGLFFFKTCDIIYRQKLMMKHVCTRKVSAKHGTKRKRGRLYINFISRYMVIKC